MSPRIVTAVLGLGLFAAVAVSGSRAVSAPPPPTAPYIDATTLANRKSDDVAKELRASGRWKSVDVTDRGSTVTARNSEKHYLVVMWDGKKLLKLSLSLPDRGDGNPASRLALVGIKGAPAPTGTERRPDAVIWTWDRGFGPFKRAEAADRPANVEIQPKWNGGRVDIFYVTKATYEKWVSAG